MPPLTTAQAAARLNITPRRVQQLINDPCPKCHGAGGWHRPDGYPVLCDRCHGTGRRLPAVKFGRDWRVEEEDLGLVEGRRVGRPRKGKTDA